MIAVPACLRPSAFAVAVDLMLAGVKLEPAEKRFVKHLAVELAMAPARRGRPVQPLLPAGHRHPHAARVPPGRALDQQRTAPAPSLDCDSARQGTAFAGGLRRRGDASRRPCRFCFAEARTGLRGDAAPGSRGVARIAPGELAGRDERHRQPGNEAGSGRIRTGALHPRAA